MKTATAQYVCNVTVIDPQTGLPVEVAMYKDMSTNGIFGIDASFIEQEEPEQVKSPFSDQMLQLKGD